MDKVDWPQRKGLSSFVKATESSESSLDQFDSHTKPKSEEKASTFKVPDWYAAPLIVHRLIHILLIIILSIHIHIYVICI